jgi:Spy/CpxP family protein refolding chaperone
MRPEDGGPGPGFGGTPEFSFEQGPEFDQMDDPENGAIDGDEEFGEGPEVGGAPGFDRGPGAFGPGPGDEAFGSMGSPLGGMPPGAALQAVLGLDEKQAQSLRQLQREMAGKLDEAQFQLRQKQGTLMDQLEQEEPDGSALVSTVKSIHALRKQVGEIEKEFQAKASAVLNEQQKSRLKSFQEARQIPRAMREAARFALVRPMGAGPGGPVPEQ